MPLSEHEQRQLEQIEQALYADYPKLAQAVRAQDPRVHYKRRVVYSAILLLLGVGLLLAGVISKIVFISVGGFVVMLAGGMWIVTNVRHMGGVVSGRGAGVARGPGGRGSGAVRGPGGRGSGVAGARGLRGAHGAGGGRAAGRKRRGWDSSSRQRFMARLEERWRRRQQGGRA